VQRTLLELTAQTISDNINNNLAIYLCGGGVHNNFLVERIEYLCPNNEVSTTYDLGINPDYLEAMAFAYFARETINKRPMNTTNNKQRILGAVTYSLN
jgi:anhydro-N-acetylmuramic acid kinase